MCEPHNYDTIQDYLNPDKPRCATPTHLGLNALLLIEKVDEQVTITVDALKVVRTDDGVQSHVDTKTEEELLKKIMTYNSSD